MSLTQLKTYSFSSNQSLIYFSSYLLTMEVCVDSLESAVNAFEGQASRIELCSSLGEGGLTPSYGLYKSIRNYLHKHDPQRRFKIHCMIRSRCGDFNYSDQELETMFEDAKKFVELDADGLVFGALTPNGDVDASVCQQFLHLVPAHVKTTFHRAFDVCRDWQHAYNQLNQLGFSHLLTSGQKRTAYEGRDLLRELGQQSRQTITDNKTKVKIIPACGINSTNLGSILTHTKCDEFHASCRSVKSSNMLFKREDIPMGSPSLDEFSIAYTDKQKVVELMNIFNQFKSQI